MGALTAGLGPEVSSSSELDSSSEDDGSRSTTLKLWMSFLYCSFLAISPISVSAALVINALWSLSVGL